MALGTGGQIALQGGFDMASGIVGNLFQKRNIRLQKDANLELANYAYDKDLEQWHLQNQYNTPQAQMTRFKQAGLNPNLIYGQGNAGNASASPKMTPVQQSLHTTKVPKINVLGMYNNQRQVEAGLAKTEADTKHIQELTNTQQSIAMIQAVNAQLKEHEKFWKLYPNSRETNDQRTKTRMFNMREAQYNLNMKKNLLLDANIDNAWMNLQFNTRKYNWYPYTQGFGMVNNAAKTALGAVGVGKLGKLGKGKAPTLKKPDTSYASWMKKGQTVNQNYSRKRLPTLNSKY